MCPRADVQVLISRVFMRHLGGSSFLRDKDTECSADCRPPASLCRGSLPWRGLYVASRALHHSSLSPAKAAAWSFRSSTLICLESADPVHTSSQTGDLFSPGFRFAPQPTVLTGPSWLLVLKQLSRSFYPCERPRSAHPQLGQTSHWAGGRHSKVCIVDVEPQLSPQGGETRFYSESTMSDYSSGAQVQIPPNTIRIQCGDRFVKFFL